MKRIMVVLAISLLMAGCGGTDGDRTTESANGSAGSSQTSEAEAGVSQEVTIHGVNVLFGEGFEGDLENCQADNDDGLETVVRNGLGQELGTVESRNGSMDELVEFVGPTDLDNGHDTREWLEEREGSMCVLIWELDTEAADDYEFSFGSSYAEYSAEEFEDMNNTLLVTYGEDPL